VRGLDQLEVPIFYNGSTVLPIGSPTFMAGGSRITNSDRMSVGYDPKTAPGFGGIYEGTTHTLTPFLAGSIIDLNASGAILWESPWPGVETCLTDATGTRSLSQLFPAGSGWSYLSAIRLNDAGAIIGHGMVGDEYHGFLLTPIFSPGPHHFDEMVSMILWGVIQGGGGLIIVGGHPRPVPPRSPLSELLASLPDELRHQIVTAIEQAQLDSPTGVRAFSQRVRTAVARYQLPKIRS
jgi:hypothetical protein